MSSGFRNSDLFIKQSQKSPSSPHTPATSVLVGLNRKWFPAKKCICYFSHCSFPYWQNTLQNVLLQPTSWCFICFLPPTLSLLKAPSVPAHELHIAAVLISRMHIHLETMDVTPEVLISQGRMQRPFPTQFFLPFSGRIHLLFFWGTFLLLTIVGGL